VNIEMPEGPEVMFIAKYIEDRYKNHTLNNIAIVSGRYVNHGPPQNFNLFVRELPMRLQRVEKKGKVLFMHFDKGWYVISKLGMTGWWSSEGDEPGWKFFRKNVVLNFKGQAPLIYCDFRNFGKFVFTNDKSVVEKEQNKITTDILDGRTKLSTIINRVLLSPKRQNNLIEDALMDQHFFVSGIGNYLKSEILYDAKISPLRQLSSLSQEDWRKLYSSARRITKKMYRVLLSRDDSKYISSMQIYRREKDKFGNMIVAHTAKNGRTTFWVPSVQK